MAHIRQLDANRFRIWWDLPPDPVTGGRRQRTRTIRGSLEDAEREAEKLERAARRAVPAASGTVRLVDYVDLFMEHTRRRQPARAPGTITWYEDKLAYVVDELGQRRLNQLTGGMLTVFYDRQIDKGLSPTTVAHTHGALRAALNQAVKWGYLAENPALRADSPGRARANKQAWTADQLRLFLAGAAKTPWLVAWTLLATTGMRRSEVAGLHWKHVDLEAGVIQVREALTSTRGRMSFGPPKTASSVRSIALDEATVALLTAHRKSQVTERLAMGEGYDDQDLVVCWKDGRPVNPDVLSKTFRRLADDLKLPRITLHDLRHTWATLALEAGVALKVVSQRLGHSSIKVTADVYTHVIDSVDREAAELVARMIRGGRR